jgi:hypothetical protein
MKRFVWLVMFTVLLVALVSGRTGVTRGTGEAASDEELEPIRQAQAGNLLANGSMEQGFYWMYPNHFVANDWLRWWIGHSIPEYDDVREWRPHRYDGSHAQVYFRWGATYEAGIYQRVAVQPCAFYQFSMYGRNHSFLETDHHARIGIDPLGREINTLGDPRVESLPPEILWSPEQTFFYTWGQHTVAAESRSDYVTVITYVSPDPENGPYDTIWDAGSLHQVPPPSGQVPEPSNWTPDGFVTGVVSYTLTGQLIVEFDTAEPASTQLWYTVNAPTTPFTPTTTFTRTTYLPLVMLRYPSMLYTPADQAGGTHHQAIIQPVEDGQSVTFVILARRLVDDTCHTSASAFFEATVPIYPVR